MRTLYAVTIDDDDVGMIKTNLGGKLVFSISLEPGQMRKVIVVKSE